MSTGLKEEMGLGEPAAQESSEQAEQFKADFQMELASINECLQYTAANAEQSKHDSMAGKRDKTYQAYQVVLGRIDPADPAVAQDSIDQVMAAVLALGTEIEAFQQAVEQAYTEWKENEAAFEQEADHVREMVDWGHDKATALQQVVDLILSKTNERKYEEANHALTQLQPKSAPLYEDYLEQKTAQEEYEPAWTTLEQQLQEAEACEFESLVTIQQEMASSTDQMRQQADVKNYVGALEILHTVEEQMNDYTTQVTELREKQQEYEQARGELEPTLTEAASSEFESLAELDQQIDELIAQTDETAAAGDYELAVQLVNELAAKAEEKIASVQELNSQRVGESDMDATAVSQDSGLEDENHSATDPPHNTQKDQMNHASAENDETAGEEAPAEASPMDADELTSRIYTLKEDDGVHQVGTIYFATESADLGSDDKQVLGSISKFYDWLLGGLHKVSFLVDGFADDRGDSAYNQTLSQQRAQIVSEYFTTTLNKYEGFDAQTKGWGEEPANGNVTDEARALGRRADIVVQVTRYDPDDERQNVESDLPGMIDQAIPLLQGTGSELDARTIRLMEKLRQPGIDDAYIDPSQAKRYVLQEMYHEGILPDEVASHAASRALDELRSAWGDPQKFAAGMRDLSEGIFLGIEEINRFYQINGEEYMSARVLHNWAMERQRDPGSILSAHQR